MKTWQKVAIFGGIGLLSGLFAVYLGNNVNFIRKVVGPKAPQQ